MSKVTSKRQVTIPKAIADRYGIRAGDDLAFIAAGDGIRVEVAGATERPSSEARLELFDAATARQRARQRAGGRRRRAGRSRGWTREQLYTRGRPG